MSSIVLYRCRHCDTSNVLPASGFICPNCRKPLDKDWKMDNDAEAIKKIISKSKTSPKPVPKPVPIIDLSRW